MSFSAFKALVSENVCHRQVVLPGVGITGATHRPSGKLRVLIAKLPAMHRMFASPQNLYVETNPQWGGGKGWGLWEVMRS